MKKLKLIAGVVLVFLLGALSGSLATGYYFRFDPFRVRPAGQTPQERTDHIVKRLSKDLALTETQKKEITEIVKQSEERLFALKSRMWPEIKTIIDQSFSRIREKLDQDQRKKLDEIREELQRWHRKAKGPPPV
ncbi:MAG: hypothetical protein AB1641_18905 [Thermodesulfobacteriota bacterium]